MVTVSDLDAKALDVLEAIYENDGEAATPAIKEYTGIDKSGIIHYRYEKLKDAGLIETRTGEPNGTKMPPTVASLTEEAETQIRGGLFGEEEATIVERMERVERRHQTVLDEFKNLEQEFRVWRYDEEADREVDVSELIDEMGEVRREVEGMREDLEAIDWEVVESVDWERLPKMIHFREALRKVSARVTNLEEAGGGGEVPDKRYVEDAVSRAEAQAETALSAREMAREAQESVEGTQGEVEELERRVDLLRAQMDARDSTLPSVSFRKRLMWLFTGSDL